MYNKKKKNAGNWNSGVKVFRLQSASMKNIHDHAIADDRLTTKKIDRTS
jgi:hypothetical protein